MREYQQVKLILLKTKIDIYGTNLNRPAFINFNKASKLLMHMKIPNRYDWAYEINIFN